MRSAAEYLFYEREFSYLGVVNHGRILIHAKRVTIQEKDMRFIQHI